MHLSGIWGILISESITFGIVRQLPRVSKNSYVHYKKKTDNPIKNGQKIEQII